MDIPLYIGLTGRMASGKGEVAKIFKKLKFAYISLSDIVREEASKRPNKIKSNNQISREALQDTGNSLREKNGPGVLAKLVSDRIKNSKKTEWLIDGIRNPAEIQELKKMNHFYLIGLQSDRNIILNRLISRKRESDIADDSELIKRMDREWGIGEPEDGQQVGECMKLADFIVNNNKTITDLRTKIFKIIAIIKEKNVK